MFKIVSKKMFSEKVACFEVEAPLIAQSRKAGHFVIVRIDEKGERIPLTIADADTEKGTITLVVQAVGASSTRLNALNAGDELADVVGPLGHATDIRKYGTVICCGGGVGVAPLLYLGVRMREMGVEPTFLLGARSQSDLLQQEAFRAVGRVFVTTEDGTAGERGFVTQHSLLQKERFTRICVCGPKPMMLAVARYAKSVSTPCEVSLENMMACGLGACLCCVEDTQQGNVCVCTEGPVFNINQLKWQI